MLIWRRVVAKVVVQYMDQTWLDRPDWTTAIQFRTQINKLASDSICLVTHILQCKQPIF